MNAKIFYLSLVLALLTSCAGRSMAQTTSDNGSSYLPIAFPSGFELSGSYEESSSPITDPHYIDSQLDALRSSFGSSSNSLAKRSQEELIARMRDKLEKGSSYKMNVILTHQDRVEELSTFSDEDPNALAAVESQVGDIHYVYTNEGRTLLIERRPVSTYSRLGTIIYILKAPFAGADEYPNQQSTFVENQGIITRLSKIGSTNIMTMMDLKSRFINAKNIDIPDAYQHESFLYNNWSGQKELQLPISTVYTLRTKSAEISRSLLVRDFSAKVQSRDMLTLALHDVGPVEVTDQRFEPPVQYWIKGKLLDDATLIDFVNNPYKLRKYNQQAKQ